MSLIKNIFFTYILFNFVFSISHELNDFSLQSGSRISIKLGFHSAQAVTTLTQANRARALYYYVAGPPVSGYPPGFTGPGNGLLSLFSEIIEDASVNKAFGASGVASCSELPTSGSISVPGHALGDLSFQFSRGKKKTPVHFLSSGDQFYERRINVSNAGVHVVSLELICPDIAGVISGYMMREENGRRVEVYFQFERNGNRRQVDAYMDYPNSTNPGSYNEKVVARFETTDGENYQIWGVRATDSISEGSFGVAVNGNSTTQQAQIATIEDIDDPNNPSDETNDSTVEVENGVQACVNLTSNQNTTGCSAVNPPASDVKGGNFSINQTTTMVVDSPELLQSDLSVYDFGNVELATSQLQTITITNTNLTTVTNIIATAPIAPFEFTGGAYPGVGGTCGTTLAASTSCTIEIEFTAITLGPVQSNFELIYDLGSTKSVTTLGFFANGTSNSAAANLEVASTATIDFGVSPVDVTKIKTFNLVNTGASIATTIDFTGLTSPFSFEGGAYPGASGTCTATLAAGSSCTFVIEFLGSSAGTFSSALNITYDNGFSTGQTTNRNFVAEANALPSLSISDSPVYDFGDVVLGGTSSHIFTVTNDGSALASSLNVVGLTAPYAFTGGTYPGTGGTCLTSLAANATCTLDISLSPTTTGGTQNQLELNYSDGSNNYFSSMTLVGSSSSPAYLTFSPASIDFGSPVVNASETVVVTVANIGAVSATGMNASGLVNPFGFNGGVFPGTGGTCLSTLSPGQTCTLEIQYSPTASGSSSNSMDLNYNDGSASNVSQLDLTGTAGSVQLTISEVDPFSFGSVSVGGSTEHTFTVTNTGTLIAEQISGTGLAQPFSFKGGSYPGAGGTCGASLVEAGSCNLVISFSPIAAGTFNDIFEINYFNGVNIVQSTRSLSGTGQSPAFLSISESDPYDFGSVVIGSSSMHTFTVTNIGSAVATSLVGSGLIAPYEFSGGTYPGTGGSCATTLAGGSSCDVVISFAPSFNGPANDVFEVNYFDGTNSQQSTRSLTGTAVSPALVEIDGVDPFDFGTVTLGTSDTFTFQLNNIGSSVATSLTGLGLNSPFEFTGGTYPGVGGNCGATLMVGALCDVVVSFSPSNVGTSTDALEINYFDGVNTQQSLRTISGTGGTPASLSISETDPYDFGSVVIANSASHALTITNTGGSSATNISGIGLAVPFGFTGGAYPGIGGTCTSTLASGSSCTVELDFSPTTTGVFNDILEVIYVDGASNQQTTRSLTGTGSASLAAVQ